ncbi:MAG: hypothetical protein II727_07075, partial [Oscillospiraceae bacterium]|nr:hypothetical protein [Oscillospiraceae bacterium]
RGVLLREIARIPENPRSFHVSGAETDRTFSLTDSWLYVFRSGVAFLALGVMFDQIETLADIVNLGGVGSRAAFSFEDAGGRHAFAFEDWIDTFTAKVGLQRFFGGRSDPFLDVFTETLAVVPERFADPDVMKQAAFNLHLMIPFDNPITDNSEEDVRFVYAKIEEVSRTYRWASCITSQTESYIVADPEMDLEKQIETRARAGLPIVMLALYEKYTCLHYTEVIAATDLKHLDQIGKLKMRMLEFQAYGTLAPANLSRWHNIRLIYGALLEVNDIPAAIADVDRKISILSEHQAALSAQRAAMLSNLITAFGIISILASVLSIIDILIGGSIAIWASLILTSILLFLVFLLAFFRKKRE